VDLERPSVCNVRRPGVGVERRTGFRGIGGGQPPSAVGLKLASTSDWLLSSANWSETILYSQVKIRLDEDGSNALAFLAGNGTGGGVHSFVGAVFAGTRSRISAFYGSYIDPGPNLSLAITDETVSRGRIITLGLRLISGTRIELWVDGVIVWTATTALTSLGAVEKYAINRRPTDLLFNFGAMTWIESQASTAALNDTEVRAAHLAAPGTPLPSGLVHNLNAVDCGPPGGVVPASINDRVSGKGTLSITSVGASIVAVPYGRPGLPPVEVFGDSKWAGRRADTSTDGGPRRYAQKRIHLSRSCAFVGSQSFTFGSTPTDFDPWHTAVGGMGLGATPAAGTTRLSTVATDRNAARGTQPAGITSLAMGVNDLYRYIIPSELNLSQATGVANLKASVDSWVSAMRVVRTGPIVIHTISRAGVASTLSTAASRAAIVQFNSEAAAMVATLNSTYGNVHLFDEELAIQAFWGAGYEDNTSALYDALHYSDATNQAAGQAYADFLLSRF
jgi:hypothetical protein